MPQRVDAAFLRRDEFYQEQEKAGVTILCSCGIILFMTAAAFMTSFDKEGYAAKGYLRMRRFDVSAIASQLSESDENGDMSGLQANKPLR